jgi:hypothetical protein
MAGKATLVMLTSRSVMNKALQQTVNASQRRRSSGMAGRGMDGTGGADTSAG